MIYFSCDGKNITGQAIFPCPGLFNVFSQDLQVNFLLHNRLSLQSFDFIQNLPKIEYLIVLQ